jgi:DNA-binding NarL/FixJ family response regulator
MTIRVLIADDEALVRAGLGLIIDAAPDMAVVGEAHDGAEAAQMVRELTPDVVLMDVQMPIADGLEATRRIVQSGSRTNILVLTTFDRDDYLYKAMKAGASGYLLKSSPPEQLINAVRVVASGDALLAPEITRRLIDDYTRRPLPGAAPRPFATLTEKESEVLLHIAAGKSNQEIAEQLFVAESTVKTHINRILAKLGARDRVQLVIQAYEAGLVQPGGWEGNTVGEEASTRDTSRDSPPHPQEPLE